MDSLKSRFTPSIWSDEIMATYTKASTMGVLSGADYAKAEEQMIEDRITKEISVKTLALLEGSVVQKGRNGPVYLLIGYDRSRPYGQRALCAVDWYGRKGKHRLTYFNHSDLTWTGDDDCVSCANIIYTLEKGIRIHKIPT